MADADARSGLTTDEQIEELRRELERAATPAQKRRTRGKKFILDLLSIIFVLLVMAVVFSLLELWSVREQDKTPTLFGYYLYDIESDGVEPLLSSGSIIFANVWVDDTGAGAYHIGIPDGGDTEDSVVVTQDRILFVMLFPIPFFS